MWGKENGLSSSRISLGAENMSDILRVSVLIRIFNHRKLTFSLRIKVCDLYYVFSTKSCFAYSQILFLLCVLSNPTRKKHGSYYWMRNLRFTVASKLVEVTEQGSDRA